MKENKSMTIKKTLESFDKKYQDWFKDNEPLPDKFKDFIKESIIQAINEITPERKEGIVTEHYQDSKGNWEEIESCKECGGYDECDCSGFNECLNQMEKNKTKFLNN